MFSQLDDKFKYIYVKYLFDIVGRSLFSASQIDPKIQQEIKAFPVGFCFAMTVFATDLGFYLRVNERHQFEWLTATQASKVDLNIQFKHIQHAFLVLSFQERTAVAFARDRMIVDGDLAFAVRLVRCLNQLEAVILPKVVATLAIKQYPQDLALGQKVKLAGRIYRGVISQMIHSRSSK